MANPPPVPSDVNRQRMANQKPGHKRDANGQSADKKDKK